MNDKPFFKALSPWSIILLLVLALIIFLPAIGEYFSAKRDLVQLWHSQGRLLSETILRSADRIVTFDQQAEVGSRERLLDLGTYVRTLDSLNYPRTRTLRQYARREAKMNSLIFDSKGNPEFSGQNPMFQEPLHKLQTLLRSLSIEDNVSFIPDHLFKQDRRNGIIIRRSEQHGFIVLLPVLRRDHRAGQNQRHLNGWMEHLTNQPSIEYIVLLRNSTRLAASGPLPQDIETRPVPESHWTIRTLADKEVFEYIQTGRSGLQVIIGLPTIALDRLQQSLVRRLIINSVLLLLLGSILVIYLIKKQNYSYLRQRYAHIQTYNTSVLENIEEGIIVLNQDRTVSVFNPAAASCLSIERDKAEGQSIEQIILPLPADIVSSFKAFEILNEVPVSLELGGKKIDLLITTNVAALQEKTDQQQIYIILLLDNTTQKELQDFRNRRSKLVAMGELASRVAHEIRNPLNGIAVLAQRIQKEFSPSGDTEEFERMARSIRGESNRINEIIEAFLNYARTPEMKLKDTILKEWIENASPLLTALGNVHIESLPSQDMQVHIDPDQMQQALVNLVKNAVEASAERVTISVAAQNSAKEISIHIDDLGPGIAPEAKEHIFDLYYTTKQKGSGLGLSIVEKIVSAHKGKVRFESPYLSSDKWIEGTRFEIVLPAIG